MEDLTAFFSSVDRDCCWKDNFCSGKFQQTLSVASIRPWTLHGVKDETDLNRWSEKLSADLCEDCEQQRLLEAMSAGVSCLCLFLQANWSGPSIKWTDDLPHFQDKELNRICSKALECDGEDVYTLAKFPSLLYNAKRILIDNRKLLLRLKVAPLWCLRCLKTYQHTLDDRSITLLGHFKEILLEVETIEMDKHLSSSLMALFHLESAHLLLHYFETEPADGKISKAMELLVISLNLSAALGKRTKFQRNNLPQLLLEVHLSDEAIVAADANPESPDSVCTTIPKDVGLDNDTLLPHVSFENKQQTKRLSRHQQAAVLASCICHHKKQAKDKLLQEEMAPYLEYVLQQPIDWCIQTEALFLRSRIEQDKSRKVERAMMQLENLINDRRHDAPEAVERLPMLHAVAVSPTWEVERYLGQVLVSLGCTKSALDVYLRIESWEDVIHCYHSLGRREKAENVIREQLAIGETPKLWCLLGDVTDDHEFYSKAWQVSKERSARAKRCLGLWYLKRKKFAECIPHLEKSLELNSLQPSIWFSFGCSHMITGGLESAATAFQRCVALDPDNSEAWSNFGSVLLRLNKRRQGLRVLQEAVRLTYDNWRMWENLLLVSVDLGEFDEAIRCFNQLLELKPKEIDTQALAVMVRQIDDALLDDNVNTSVKQSLIPKVLKLFGRITSQITSNHVIWRLYAHMYLLDIEQKDASKAFQFLIKSQNCAVQHTKWRLDAKMATNVMDVSLHLLEVAEMVAGSETDDAQRILILSSPTSAVGNFIIQFQKESLMSDDDENAKVLREKIELLACRLRTLQAITSA